MVISALARALLCFPVVCLSNHSHITQVSADLTVYECVCWRHAAIYISAGRLALKTWAKAVKNLSSILSALSSVFSDCTVSLTPYSPPSWLMEKQSPCTQEIQGRTSRGPLKLFVFFCLVHLLLYVFPFVNINNWKSC